MPRPEYRPFPDPRPRPTRLRDLRGCAGVRLERFSSSLTALSLLDAPLISQRSHGHEMAYLAQHALQLRRVLVVRAATDLAEAERAQGTEVTIGLTDSTTHLRDLQLAHSLVSSVSAAPTTTSSASFAAACFAACAAAETGRTWAIVRPRIAATSSGRTSRLSPSTVARHMLIGFVVPRLFASTSRIPASSSTARVPPPAMTPVPSLAGRSTTRAASNRPTISCVIVCPCFGTEIGRAH